MWLIILFYDLHGCRLLIGNRYRPHKSTDNSTKQQCDMTSWTFDKEEKSRLSYRCDHRCYSKATSAKTDLLRSTCPATRTVALPRVPRKEGRTWHPTLLWQLEKKFLERKITKPKSNLYLLLCHVAMVVVVDGIGHFECMRPLLSTTATRLTEFTTSTIWPPWPFH